MGLAVDAYEAFPITQRLRVSYEELLRDPAPHLLACGELVSVKVDRKVAVRVAGKHQFREYKTTGPLEFRRHGRAGVWKESGNFTPEVLQVAHEILGPLRGRLGYRDS
jgi:hypothetical protein